MHPRIAALALAALLSLPTAPPSSRQASASERSPAAAAPEAGEDASRGGNVSVPEVYRSVLEYGLRADGRTREGAKLNSAIEQLSRSGGGHLFVPSGRTVFAGGERVFLRRNVVLEGRGAGAGIRWGKSTHERGIHVMGSNSGVNGLVLSGPAGAGGRQQFAVWMDGPLKDVSIDHNRFRRWHVAVAVRSFRGRTPGDFSISNNVVEPPVRWSRARQVQVISLLNHSPIGRISRFRVDGNEIHGAPNGGIFIDGGRGFSISGNHITSTTGPKLGGSMIGVYTEYGGDTADGVVAGNTVVGNGREVAGIELNAGLDQIVVSNNLVVGARHGIAYWPGVEGDPYPRSRSVVVRANQVFAPRLAGVVLDGAADRVVYEDNVVFRPRTSGFHLNVHRRDTKGAGVVSLVLRRNLVVSGRTGRGFWIGDAARVTFENNTVCHPVDGRVVLIGLEIAPKATRFQGRGNLLEGSVAAVRFARETSPVERQLTALQYSPTPGCPVAADGT